MTESRWQGCPFQIDTYTVFDAERRAERRAEPLYAESLYAEPSCAECCAEPHVEPPYTASVRRVFSIERHAGPYYVDLLY